MNPGAIHQIPPGFEFQSFAPRPEIIALVQEVQRQNAAILQQNALILRLAQPIGIISGEVDGGTMDFDPASDRRPDA